jgi:ubiquinone/menaquinone biosynthesis C-methylase UbiE
MMDRPMRDVHFAFMRLCFGFRDLLFPPKPKLIELGIIGAGNHILDYGFGTGSYSIVAGRLVGDSGRIYALDIQPLAIQRLEKLISKKRLKNVMTIHTDCATGLEQDTIDVILLFDTLHGLNDSDGVLRELHRVLKLNGLLCVNDHHMKEDQILSEITQSHLFILSRRHKTFYLFSKL